MSDSFDSGSSSGSSDYGSSSSGSGYTPSYEPPSRPDPTPSYSGPVAGWADPEGTRTPQFAESSGPRHALPEGEITPVADTGPDFARYYESPIPTAGDSHAAQAAQDDLEEDGYADLDDEEWTEYRSFGVGVDPEEFPYPIPARANTRRMRAVMPDGGWVTVESGPEGRATVYRFGPTGEVVALSSIRDLLGEGLRPLEPWVDLPESPEWSRDLDAETADWPEMPEAAREVATFHFRRAQGLHRTLKEARKTLASELASWQGQRADLRASLARASVEASEFVREADIRRDAEKRVSTYRAVSAALVVLILALVVVWVVTS